MICLRLERLLEPLLKELLVEQGVRRGVVSAEAVGSCRDIRAEDGGVMRSGDALRILLE
ncbi:MAG: hypothetical protein AAGJ35_12275 [Myxococcota bacterium]